MTHPSSICLDRADPMPTWPSLLPHARNPSIQPNHPTSHPHAAMRPPPPTRGNGFLFIILPHPSPNTLPRYSSLTRPVTQTTPPIERQLDPTHSAHSARSAPVNPPNLHTPAKPNKTNHIPPQKTAPPLPAINPQRRTMEAVPQRGNLHATTHPKSRPLEHRSKPNSPQNAQKVHQNTSKCTR